MGDVLHQFVPLSWRADGGQYIARWYDPRQEWPDEARQLEVRAAGPYDSVDINGDVIDNMEYVVWTVHIGGERYLSDVVMNWVVGEGQITTGYPSLREAMKAAERYVGQKRMHTKAASRSGAAGGRAGARPGASVVSRQVLRAITTVPLLSSSPN